MDTITLSAGFRKLHQIPDIRIKTKGIDAKDPEWRSRAKEALWWESGNLKSEERFLQMTGRTDKEKALMEYRQFLQLHQTLLAIGGCETCFPAIEEDMGAILERGRFYKGTSKMMPGRPNGCHENTCRLWEANHANSDVHIATGYALSGDGIWRQHSWLVHRYRTAMQHRTQIIETTRKRVAYYGFEMMDAEAENFCYHNL